MNEKQKAEKKLEAIHTNFPPNQITVPEVFILESLSQEDEKERRFEGRLLSEMLLLAGKNPKYFYFQSKEELPHLIALFRLSQYRYLHFSSHANEKAVATTNDSMSYGDFGNLFQGSLKLRRLFMSSCEVGNQTFVDAIAKNNKGMHSIIAPSSTIDFDHAAAIWSAFYVSIFSLNENSMRSRDISERFSALKILFPVEFYKAFYNANKDNWIYEN